MAKLKRSLSLTTVTFYGIGTIIGAGIYVLIGKVAGAAGMYAPFAFLISALLAAFTGFSYAELSSRIPHSGGEVSYTQEAFKWKWLSTLVGLSVVLTGLVSAAAIANGFAGYLQLFLNIEDWLAITILILTFGLLAVWGIEESARVVTTITLIEIAGLVIVLSIAGHNLSNLPEKLPELTPPFEMSAWTGILLGGFLAFYAYVGFEDMVNLAEEVKDVRKNLPLAIVIALVVSTILYILVSLVAILSLPIESLQGSKAPLALIVEKAGHSTTLIGVISLIAVANGALVQIIMSSRVLFGMGKRGLIHKAFSNVNQKTQTPILSTIVITLAVLGFALWLPIVTLAKTTSFIILCVFALVNLSLVILKVRQPNPKGITKYPMIIPIIGFVLTIAILLFQILA